jgi:hypothetical protein
MIVSEFAKNQSAFASNAQDRSPFVLSIRCSVQQSFAFGAINEFHGTVVLQPEPLGSIRDRYGRRFGSSYHLEKKLMLLRVQSCFKSRGFAKEQKAPQFKAKLR